VEVSLREQADDAKAFLEGLVERFGAEAEVKIVEIDEDTVELQVTGDDLGLLIGPKGQTLAAVQDLTRTAVQQHGGGSHGRLMVDVAGYRQKRRVALEAFTRQQVERVQSSGTRLVLEPMSPADRKVVHDTVNTVDGMRTASEGEEPYRRVVILPEDD
jgi:spoIIIJ-associated protein